MECLGTLAARDGRWLEAAGIVLVRQRPGSAKGVLLVTLEDETGIASLVVWPKAFEQNRRTIMSASMLALRGPHPARGRGGASRRPALPNLSAELASVGGREADFPLPHGRGDEIRDGGSGPDPRDRPPKVFHGRDLADPCGHIDSISAKTRAFR